MTWGAGVGDCDPLRGQGAGAA